jgi:hypothetical protein
VTNLGMVERVLRVALGGAVAIAALGMFIVTNGILPRLGYGAFVALGVDFVVTGIRGYCPLYARFGWSTAPSNAHI